MASTDLPWAVPINNDLVVQTSARPITARGHLWSVELFNGHGIYSDAINLRRASDRKKWVSGAAEVCAALDRSQALDALQTLAFSVDTPQEGASDDVGGDGETPRGQLSLSPPGFVCVALDADGQRVYVLHGDDDAPVIAPSAVGTYKGEMVTHMPPPDLPWLLPHADTVLRHYDDAQSDPEWSARLLSDLEQWHRQASDLGRDEAYLLLSLYDLLTYAPEQTDYFAIICLEAEPERGKTRTGQAAAYVCRHGMHIVGIREANLLRAAGDRQATLFIDLMSLWETAKREKCEDILLARWERGGYVERVQNPDRGAFRDTERYETYGPTIVGTNEPVHRIFDTRCLRVDMPLTSRRFTGRVRPEDALPLVERLTAWRAMVLVHELPDCGPPADGRLGDILRPLRRMLHVVAPHRAEEFNRIVQWQVKRRHDDLAGSTEAAIVTAIWSCAQLKTQGWVRLLSILEVFNADRGDQAVKPRWLGQKVRSLGWTVERRGHDNATSVEWDDDLMMRLRRRYGLDTT